MADAVKKKRAPQGPRQARPLYLITKSPVEVVSVTRNPLDIVKAMTGGEQVSFIDITPLLPAPQVRKKAAA